MKNFHVMLGQCNSIIFPKSFSLGNSKYLLDLPLGDNMILLTDLGIFPQIYYRTLCPVVLICKGF